MRKLAEDLDFSSLMSKQQGNFLNGNKPDYFVLKFLSGSILGWGSSREGWALGKQSWQVRVFSIKMHKNKASWDAGKTILTSQVSGRIKLLKQRVLAGSSGFSGRSHEDE